VGDVDRRDNGSQAVPGESWHRIIGSRVLARLNALEEARKAAQAALKLADDDAAARKEAERILAILANK
jgi:hypothetical protein